MQIVNVNYLHHIHHDIAELLQYTKPSPLIIGLNTRKTTVQFQYLFTCGNILIYLMKHTQAKLDLKMRMKRPNVASLVLRKTREFLGHIPLVLLQRSWVAVAYWRRACLMS